MAGQRIDIMDLRQLIQLKRKGMTNRKVAKALGVSRNTVNAYTQVFKDQKLSYQQLEGFFDVGLAFRKPTTRIRSGMNNWPGIFLPSKQSSRKPGPPCWP